MGIPLRRLFLGLIWLAGTVVLFPSNLNGQSLKAGDIAFVGFNADGNSDFAIVLFKDINAGQKIHFSNKDWTGEEFTGKSDGDFTWQVPTGGLPAGTVVVFNDLNDTKGRSVNYGTLKSLKLMNISSAGDVLFAFTGPDKREPATFLAAISTDESKYERKESTLNNTGLQKGTTAILLPENIDVAEYVGHRSGNTKRGYLEWLNEDNDEKASLKKRWKIADGNGDQSKQVLPFNTAKFKIVKTATVRFASETPIRVKEDAGAAAITVVLAEANHTPVHVDIKFLSSASSAGLADIGNYTTERVYFNANDQEGTKKTIRIDITDNDEFEGLKRAVFQLQNSSNGTIIEPRNITVEIIDDDKPHVVINEILYAPDDDANGDGEYSSSGDEFVEIVNSSESKMDMSNWTLSDANKIRFTFPEGTVIGENGALVVFGAPAVISPSTNFGGADLFSGGSLSLNNSGDHVVLKNASGITIDSVSYDNSVKGQSITRNPDITGDFIPHGNTTKGEKYSPGTKIDGKAFGVNYAVAIQEAEAWHMIASPTKNTTFSDLFSELWTQGAAGSDDPGGQNTLYYWDESKAQFSPVIDMNNVLEAGRGYILYVFEDDEYSTPGLQGGFPKKISTDGEENDGILHIPVTSIDINGDGVINNAEGWNMLGNPYGTDIWVDEVLNALEAVNPNINANIYIWNPNKGAGNGGYETLKKGISSNPKKIAPFQAFFVRYTESIEANKKSTFERSKLAANEGSIFYDRVGKETKSFKLFLGNGDKYDEYAVRFSPNGRLDEDRYDAYKLFSLNPQSINLFSILRDGTKLAVNVLPPLTELDRELHIALGCQLPVSGKYTFRWGKIDKLPQNITLHLIDRETGRKVDLRKREEFSFNHTAEAEGSSKKTAFQQKPLLNKAKNDKIDTRFEIVMAFAKEDEPETPMKELVTMAPNYPNPFKGQTTIEFKLKESNPVTMTVWNIVGQKVAVICDHDSFTAGLHTKQWVPTSTLPSGIYILKLEAAGKVLIRKMTLIK